MTKRITVLDVCKGVSEFGAFRNGPLFTNKDNLTNGGWLILKDFIPKNLLKKAITEGPQPIEPDIWEEVDIAKPTSFLSDKGDYLTFTFDGGNDKPKKKTRLTRTLLPKKDHYHIEQEEINFNKKYILFFQKWIPDFSIKAYDNEGPAYIYSGSKLAGVLMPYRI